MTSVFNISIIILAGIGLAQFVYIIILKLSEDKEYIMKGATAWNFSSKYSNGCAYGIEKKVEIGDGGRFVIDLIPRDIDPDLIDKVKPVRVVLGKGKRILMPIGSWSGEKNTAIYLPPHPEDIPDDMKDTNLGKSLMKMTEEINSMTTELSVVRDGSTRKTKILERIGDGELSEKEMQRIDEISKDVVRLIQESKSSTKQPFAQLPPEGFGGRV